MPEENAEKKGVWKYNLWAWTCSECGFVPFKRISMPDINYVKENYKFCPKCGRAKEMEIEI